MNRKLPVILAASALVIAVLGSAQSAVGAPPFAVPSGAVMFFDLASCPPAWTALPAAQGRYLVGLPASGTLGAQVGTALSDQEDRPVGLHDHTINDPGHSHSYDKPVLTSTGSGSSKAGIVFDQQTGISTTGITVNPAGTVPGTNAPYIQLLVCKKS